MLKKTLIVVAAAGLAACGSVEGEKTDITLAPPVPQSSEATDEPTTEESTDETTEPATEDPTTQSEDPTAEPLNISVTPPSDWSDVLEGSDFAYHYMWDGNDWDDILAQRFSPPYPDFTPEAYIEILNRNLSGHEAGDATVRYREDVEIGGYPGFILDVDWQSADTLTSLTYLEVDGWVWELTANAQDAEGLAAAEKINSEARFN